jgi:hypothetical protein
MRRCEDEKMRYRRPLFKKLCPQTLSGKNSNHVGIPILEGSTSVGCDLGGSKMF